MTRCGAEALGSRGDEERRCDGATEMRSRNTVKFLSGCIITLMFQSAQSEIFIYGIKIDTIFTVSTSLFVFILGFLLNKFNEYLKERKRLNDVKSFFLTQVSDKLKFIKDQADSYKQVAKEIMDERHQDFVFKEFSDLNFVPIEKIPHIDIFNSVRRGKRKEAKERLNSLRDIFDAIEFFKRSKLMSSQNNEEFIQSFRRYQERWNENTDFILRQFDNFILNARINSTAPFEDPFLSELDNIVNSWRSRDSKDFAVVKEFLLEPIKVLCKGNRRDSRISVLLPAVLNSLTAFENIQHIAEIYSDFFEDQAEQLELRRNKLIKSIICLKPGFIESHS